MKHKLFKIPKVISVRLVSFLLTFFCALVAVYFWASFFQIRESIPKPNIETRLLNVKIYRRSPKEDCSPVPRPDPLILVASLDKNKKLHLNMEDYDLENTSSFEKTLSQILKEREMNPVFDQEGTQIENRIFIKIDASVEYGDLVKIIDALNRAGADPIYIDPFQEKCTYALGAS